MYFSYNYCEIMPGVQQKPWGETARGKREIREILTQMTQMTQILWFSMSIFVNIFGNN